MGKKRILILDLDTPIYSAAAVVDNRSILVTHTPTKMQKVFKTRTEFKDRLSEKGILDKLDEYIIVDQQHPEPIENACQILKVMVGNIEEAVQADEVLFFVSGIENFREELELPTKYKSNRSNTIKPVLLTDVKKFAINKFKPQVCNFDEPDDRIIYTAYQLQKRGCEPILGVYDKDALAYSGIKMYNPDKPEQGIVEIPKLGSLRLDEKGKVRGNGFLWYCFQHLVGDATDGFKPTELCGIKFGEKSAYKLLKDAPSEVDALTRVVEQYKQWYPEPITYVAWNGQKHTKNWEQIADMYFKCARMKSHEFDELNFSEFCENYGVKL